MSKVLLKENNQVYDIYGVQFTDDGTATCFLVYVDDKWQSLSVNKFKPVPKLSAMEKWEQDQD